MEKTKVALESPQSKKKPLRDQHALREKLVGDCQIQKTKIALSVEKLKVSFNFSGWRTLPFPHFSCSFTSDRVSAATPRWLNPLMIS